MSNDANNYPEDSFENMKKFAKINDFKFPYLYDETQEHCSKLWSGMYSRFFWI